MRQPLICAFICIASLTRFARAVENVAVVRVPNGGIQAQAMVDDRGALHVVYFTGDPAHGDLLYVRSTDGGAAFSEPIRVNSQPGSAIAIGTVRGARMAIGRHNRIHIAWNGSTVAEPKAAGNAVPMLYARLNDAGSSFEAQRNIIQLHPGLDGGGAVAADANGNVYVAWHAPTVAKTGEADRRVWVARSTDDGRTFADETPATEGSAGACGCCGMALFADPHGRLFALYRSATQMVHRDTYLLASNDQGKSFKSSKVGPMRSGQCIMSTPAFAGSANSNRVLAAWETQGQIFWSAIDPATMQPGAAVSPPGTADGRKYPAIAVDEAGNVLLAWTEGMGWQKGGSLAWQVFDSTGSPIPGQSGRARGVPAWDLPAAFSRADGSFGIIY